MNRWIWGALGSVGALVVAAVVYILVAGRDAPTIVVVSWGAAYTKSQVEAYHKPFMRETGVSITSVDYNGDIGLIKAQVEKGNVEWDIVDFEVADAMRACDEGLLEKLDLAQLPPAPDGTPAEQDFLKGALDPCYVATIVFSHVMAYSTAEYPARPPASAADFFDLASFPGKRGLRRQSPKVNLELALLADGVPRGEVYAVLGTPEGLARAFAKLDTIKADVVWWTTGAQPPQLLADGAVVMTTAYNGRIFDAQMAGKPFAIIWQDHLLDLDVWGIVKGAPNKERAFAFLKFSTSTAPLAEQARWIAYSPARNSSIELMEATQLANVQTGQKMLPHMPTAPENIAGAVPLNHRWWAERQDELTERWNAWLAR